MEPGPPAGDRTARRLRRLDARESAAISAGLPRPPPPPPPPRRITLGRGTGGSLSSPHSAGATAGYSTPASRLASSAFPPSMGTAVPFGLPEGDADLEGGAASNRILIDSYLTYCSGVSTQLMALFGYLRC